jgi:two-component system, NarL family, nitrate/nitrite response regulator NarL
MPGGKAHIRILIADDHPIFRDGLRRLLEAERGLEVVGEASDGEETVRVARQVKPDLVLLDLNMPRYSGHEALKGLASLPSVRTIVLAAAIDREQIVDVLQGGARGIVLKESATQILIKSIHSVMAGQYWVGRDGVANIVQALRDLAPSPTGEPKRKNFGLTQRELEIVAAIVAGYSNKDIAGKFSLSEQTVKHHLTNIFDKLGVSSRLELALFASHHRLVKED